MENYDSNMIKPVDSLQNIIGVAPARRREQRRRRKQMESEKKEQEQKQNRQDGQQSKAADTFYVDNPNDSKIDYRA